MSDDPLQHLLEYAPGDVRVLYSDQGGKGRRLGRLTALPLRRAVSVARGDLLFAVYPSLVEPSFAYPLATPAAAYARSHLFPPVLQAPATLALHRAASAWIGCDPRVAAVAALRGTSLFSRLPARVTGMCRRAGESKVGTTAIAIRTTRPLYLVFGSDGDRPLWAARLGSEAALQREFDLIAGLWALDPELVPAPVLCTTWQGNVWISVQRGVPGLPWFRHKHLLHSADASTLTKRMLRALQRLHAVVSAQSQWRRPFRLGASIREQISRCAGVGVRLPAALQPLLERYGSDGHDSLAVEWFWQHGDFSLNNLIISDGRATLIDFEDFGHIVAPLHDELGLAISLSEVISRTPGAQSLRELIAFCVHPTLSAYPRLKPYTHALLVHHLLWRLADSAARPTRVPVTARIGEQLQSLASNPSEWLG